MQKTNESKSFAQQAFDDLPFWMRQMMHDKVQKCLAADANEEIEDAKEVFPHLPPIHEEARA